MEAQTFKTSDMQLAITLQTLGQPLVDVEPGLRKLFVFPDSPKLRNLVDLYWKRQLKTEPQSLWMNYKIVKNRMNAF